MTEKTNDYPHLSLENLMVCLLEEASEVAKAMSKAKRFGLDDYPPNVPGAMTNKTKIASELGDLIGVINLINREHCGSDDAFILAVSHRKEERIRENYGKRFAP